MPMSFDPSFARWCLLGGCNALLSSLTALCPSLTRPPMRQASLRRDSASVRALAGWCRVACACSTDSPNWRSSPIMNAVTDIVVLPQAQLQSRASLTMSTSPDPGSADGHNIPSPDDSTIHATPVIRVQNDASDAQSPQNDAPSPASADAVGSPDEGAEPEPAQEDEEMLSDSASNNDRADDGDFVAEPSPTSEHSNNSGAAPRPASTSSRPAAKRKATSIMDDEYIRENPELYGLRRSVCSYPAVCVCVVG